MNGRSAFRSVLAIFVTALLLGARTAYASDGPSITALAIDRQTPTTLYAGTSDRGVFKSVDAGATWSLTGLIGIRVTSLAIDARNPSTIYAGTQGGGVFRFKSADEGGTWVAVNTGLPDPNVAVVVIDPLPATTLHAVVTSGPNAGVFKSTNSGDTWISMLSSDDPSLRTWPPSEFTMIYTLVSAPALEPAGAATLYAGVSYGAVDSTLEAIYWGEVVKSTDAGSSWSNIRPRGWNIVWGRLLAVTPPTPNGPATIYSAPSRDYDLCWTSDDGATFTCARLSDTPAPVSSIVVDPQNPRIIYAGTSLGVYKSENQGESWKALNSGLTDTLEAYGAATSIQALAIAPHTSTTLYAGTDVGLFETKGNTEIWTPTSLFQSSPLKSVVVDPSYVEGGDTSTATVALVSAAPEGGVTLAVSSSDTGRATVPATVTVAGGDTSTTFLVSTSPVALSNEVIISAAFSGAQRHARLAVTIPIRVYAVNLLPNVMGGRTVNGTVYMNERPMGNVVVALASSDPHVAAVPASVTVTASSDSTEFMVSTTSVAVPTPVTISATYAGVTSSFVVGVNPTDFFSSLTLNPASVPGGSDSTGTVTLSAAAVNPVFFQLFCGDNSLATVPTMVTVPAGAASATFVVSTKPVDRSTQVQIGAIIFDGGSSKKSVTLGVTGPPTPPIPIVAVGLNPASVPGGNSSTAWVTIGAPAPAEGMTIILSSSNTAVATVPATVTVPAWVTSAGVTVLTRQVTASTEVIITATSNGDTRSGVLTVNPSADIAAPDTSVTSIIDGNGTPLGNGGATLSNVATVAFVGTDNAAVAFFECRLDGASVTSCSSPSQRIALAVGWHDFEVWAVDTSNNPDGTPARSTWFVDLPPDTTITSAVDWNGNRIRNGGTIHSNPITFSFTAMDNLGVRVFECSLDGATFTVCASPATHTGAGRGSHTFRVRAVDINGFRDATPASFAWKR
jgi:hypothetical protein